jgi:hypothetical protein
MSSTGSSLVLGAAFRLPPAHFEPFARSLRATGYGGKFGLIIGGYNDADSQRFDELADFTVRVDALYERPFGHMHRTALHRARHARGLWRTFPLLFYLSSVLGTERGSAKRWQDAEFYFEGLQSLRHSHCYTVLQELAPDAEEILLTDVRDVLFQADPFERPVDGLEVFLEEELRTIKREPWNRRWIRGLYGKRVVDLIGDFTVSCSGTVIGPRAKILHYLREMSEAIAWRRRPLGYLDQGVHNYLLRTGRLGQPNVVRNGYGRVLTLGGMKDCRLQSDGSILNADNTLPAVLHQYDRQPKVADRLLRRLAE